MTLAVFTPTYRPGGIDVLLGSLERQIFKDFVWIVSDQRFLRRKDMWGAIANHVDFEVLFLSRMIQEGNKRNLCAMYNAAADYTVEKGYDMLISLQDYIYVDEDGLQKFVDAHEKFPNSLLTGVTHISRDPYPNKIYDLEGDYSIFMAPFTTKPKRLSWEDVRVTQMYTSEDTIHPVETGHWEANWAAVPVHVLDLGIRWDENYDKGIAYENMDFAQQAKGMGYNVVLDKTNVAISLPHKDYFEGEREEIVDFSNREYYESKWM